MSTKRDEQKMSEHYSNLKKFVDCIQTRYPLGLAKFKETVKEEIERFPALKFSGIHENQVIKALLKLLYVRGLMNGNDQLPTPFFIDQVWHKLLLMPRFYAEVCAARQSVVHNEDWDPANFSLQDIIPHDLPDRNKTETEPVRFGRMEELWTIVEEYFGEDDLACSVLWNERLFNEIVQRNNVVSTNNNKRKYEDVMEQQDEEVKEEDLRKKVAKHFNVRLTTLQGEVVNLRVKSTTTVLEVKQKYFERKAVPIDQQRLISRGRELKDHLTMDDYKIEGKETVYVVVRLRGC